MAEDKMSLEDWLDDLCVRFIVNLGHADLSDTARICFQIEEAQWFYEDFIRPLDPQLPSMTLKQFSLKMFQHCPLFAGFQPHEHQMAFEKFLQYKTRIPVRGAIMLNAAMDSAVLVRGWKKGASWSFPRGKINKDEDDLDCAVREVVEETGFDLRQAGLVESHKPVQYVEVTMKDQHVRLYVFRDVPEDTHFAPKARKEIGAIHWYKLTDLPTFKKKKGKNADATSADRFYMVAPFMMQLRNWIKQQKKERAPPIVMDEGLTDDNVFYPQSSANNGDVDYAAKELQNLHVGPEAHTQPQIQTGPAHEAASAHLMALLQSNPMAGSAVQPQQQQQHNHHQVSQAQLQAQQQQQQQQEWLQIQQQQAHQQHQEQLIRLEQQNREKLIRAKQEAEQRYQQQIKQQHQDYQHMTTQQYPQQHYPHTPQEQMMAAAPQPRSPRQHHLAQRMHPNDYAQLPPSMHLPASGGNAEQYQQQHQQQHASGPTQRHVAPRHYQSAPVQLVHPQPMPAPQVVSAMVNNYGNDYTQNAASGPAPQKNMATEPQADHASQAGHNGQYQQGGRGHSANAPMPAHSMNLLNAFMGGASVAKPQKQQQGAPLRSSAAALSQQPAQPSSLGMGASLRPQATSDFAPQVISGPETRSGNFGPSSPGAQPRSMDKHHMSLLDMFKVAPQPVMPNQSVRREPLPQQSKQQERQISPPHSIQELPTMADVMKTAAQENGRPIQMSSETNLPYGAVTILARPQSNQTETKDVQSQAPAAQNAPQSPLRPIREPRIGSKDRSGFPAAKVSPRQIHTQSQKNVTPAQLSPQGHFGKLQHGHTQSPLGRMQGFGSDVSRAKSPLSQVHTSNFPQDAMRPSVMMMMPTPPSATHLPLPGMPKARRESTAEHKQSLLSLFGQPKGASDTATGKGKEVVFPDMYGSGSHPRSRVASVASSVGTGLPNGSRRGSQSPLSSQDKNFLLGFLQTAASNKTH